MPKTPRKKTSFLMALAACCLSLAAFAQPADKPIGFAVSVSATSLFGGKVERITVSKVMPASQALAAGLAEGDEIIEIEGLRVVGAEAGALKPHLRFEPGQPKRLRLKRSNGTEYDAVLTKPAKP